MDRQITKDMIAPCGIDCTLCMSVQERKPPCPGCRNGSKDKPLHCIKCSIVNCEELKSTASGFCYECVKYPCQRLKSLDARYRKNHRVDLLKNLEFLEKKGLDEFVRAENDKWKCRSCGKLLCMHRDVCLHCGTKRKRFGL